MAGMRKALIATLASMGIALAGCSGSDDGPGITEACAEAASAYQSAMDALVGSQDEWMSRLDAFESLLTKYGDSLGGDNGVAFKTARTKLDAQQTIDTSLSEVNAICKDAGVGAVTDLGD